MKRITAIILALVMCMLLTVPAFATTALNIRVGDAECVAGGTATVTVSLENNPGITYLSLSIVCDSTFTISKATNGSIISSMTSGRQYVWSCDENASGNGVLLTLQIDVPSTAETKDYPISVTVRGCNNYDEEDVVTNVIPGTITVKCAHAHTENRAEQPATCKDVGYTAGVYCLDCETYISGHQEIAKTNNHTYGKWAKVNDTTHKHTCSVCGKEETASHNWNSGTVTTQPTHLAEGVKTYTCSDCGATKTEAIIGLTAHTYGEWTKHNETQHKRSCACGDVQYENHKWDAGKITTQPTCKNKGVKTYTCIVCGATKTEEVPTTNNHTYGKWVKVNETTHKHTCSVCGKEETANHNWNSGTVTTQPTHLAEGVKTYTCSDCGATKTEAVSKLTAHTYGDWIKHNGTQHKRSCACGDVQYEDHKWDAGKITTQPTCKNKGVKTYTCSVCGETKTEEVPTTNNHTYGNWVKVNDSTHKHTCSVCGKEEIANHNWNSGTVTTQPTHLAEGVKTYTCSDCGATKTEAVSKLTAHTYGDWAKHNETQHKRSCACGDVQYENHKWDAGKVTTQPTCKNKGVKTYTCSVCGETKTEEVPVTNNHSYSSWTKISDTQHKHTCSVCGKEEISAHTWNAGSITKQPTCKDKGVKTYTCTGCGATKTEEVPTTNNHTYGKWVKVNDSTHKHICSVCGKEETASHNWNSGTVTTQPTEDHTGIRTYTCATCGATKEGIIPKLDHQHKYGSKWYSDASNHWVECSCGDKNKISAHTWDSGVVTKAATCLEDGIMTYTCTVCGYTKTETVKGEHSVGEWVIVREATCSVDGLKERKCSVCGEVIESEDIKATGHTAGEWITSAEPTCTETGLKQQKCSVCSEVIGEETIPATGHHFGDWTVENGVLKRTCSCGETETKNIDKKAEELPPSEDGIKVNIDGSGSLPEGTAVKTDDLMDDLSETEKEEITNAVKVIVSDDDGIELVSIYDISLEFEGAKIQPDGTVKVELPIPAETDEKFDSYQVVYIDDNGVAHEMPTEVKDGKIIFTTDHFSKYAVVGIMNTDAPSDPTTNNNIIPYVVVGSVVILAAVVLVIILSKKRKRA